MRFKDTLVAVMVLIKDGNKVLLQKRQNTGYMDGYWDFSATGHVEYGESIIDAGVRESLEEIGVTLQKIDFKLMTMMHKFTEESKLTYVNAFFIVESFEGVPMIKETDKWSELKWFDLERLPSNVIFDRLIAIKAMKDNTPYLEIGW
jgi:mutator protein MutT